MNENNLPDEVRAAMIAVLTEALLEAARTEDPGDGGMISLSGERNLGKGIWDGGWKLQPSFVQDERMNPRPFVAVYAYKDGNLAKGSVAADVVRTDADRQFLNRRRLAAMVKRRDDLNLAIEKLSLELGDA